MFKLVCFLNASLTFPFAVLAIAAPAFTFGQFGLDVGPEGDGIVRGYGAAALGWGLVCLMLRQSTSLETVRAILLASLAFNGAEVAIQVPVAQSGIASDLIWVTICGHGATALASLAALALSWKQVA